MSREVCLRCLSTRGWYREEDHWGAGGRKRTKEPAGGLGEDKFGDGSEEGSFGFE